MCREAGDARYYLPTSSGSSSRLSDSHSRRAHLSLTTSVRPARGSNAFVAASSGVLHGRALWPSLAGPAREKCPGSGAIDEPAVVEPVPAPGSELVLSLRRNRLCACRRDGRGILSREGHTGKSKPFCLAPRRQDRKGKDVGVLSSWRSWREDRFWLPPEVALLHALPAGTRKALDALVPARPERRKEDRRREPQKTKEDEKRRRHAAPPPSG
jgi:hypothetical protein